MINDPMTAMYAILTNNTTITNMLGKKINSNIPAIFYGVIPKMESNLSALSFYLTGYLPDQELRDVIFTVNCFAGNTNDNSYDAVRNSFLLAETLVNELNGCDSGINGYTARN